MNKIAFVGFGQLGQQIFTFVEQISPHKNDYLFFDDKAYSDDRPNSRPFQEYRKECYKNFSFCVCLGYKYLRLKNDIIEELNTLNRSIFTFVHPTAYVDATATIDPGVIIYPNCTIDQRVKIGSGTLINNSSVISHDSTIGTCCFIAPGVTVSGFVHIEKQTFIGTATAIANNLYLGEGCIIGTGSVITKNLPKKTIGIGNPFQVKNKLNLV